MAAPVAVVYRGPATSPGCAEAVAELLAASAWRFRVRLAGADELAAGALRDAALYAQPGGGDLAPAYRRMRRHRARIREFVRSGGRYLGFCLGGYLAGATPGFGLLPGDTDQYIASAGASVPDESDTVVRVRWRDRPRHVYFQDGPHFWFEPGAEPTVLATYDNGTVAAAVVRFGAGAVGVCGPHPEADESWYAEHGLSNPDGIRPDLGHDLIDTTMRA
ncbi:BPL-N domain-containing protein [Saccharopolyspora rosea]|uniref:BPL-N domain-containing protein n=1 Tax=Saccharopolyspora rosea TaxID=524884 RepID=A0ABW3FPU5_9PSEU|nr:BPL-N domain-containing protein [Saccharopolyspora rosea]